MITSETPMGMGAPANTERANSASCRKKTSWLVLLLGLFWLAVILGGAYLTFTKSASDKLTRIEIERLKSLNLPTDNESLDRWFRERTSTDGTETWREIYFTVTQLFPKNATSSIEEDDFGFFPDAPKREVRSAMLASYVSQMSPVLDKIHSASRNATPTYFPLVFNGFDTLLEPLQTPRTVSRLLTLELKHAVHENDHERAMRALTSLKSSAVVTDWSIGFVSELVHIALLHLHFDAINRTLAGEFWTEPEIDLLIRQIDEPIDIQTRWRATVASERAMALASPRFRVSQLASGSEYGHGAYSFLPGFRLRYLEFSKECETLSDEGLEQFSRKAQILDERVQSEEDDAFAQMLAPSIQSIAYAYWRSEILRRLTMAALGVKKFQLQNERWPEELSEIGSVGMDSQYLCMANGVPFFFEALDSGCRIATWKVGPRISLQASNEGLFKVEVGDKQLKD